MDCRSWGCMLALVFSATVHGGAHQPRAGPGPDAMHALTPATTPHATPGRYQAFGTTTKAVCTSCQSGYAVKSSGRACCEWCCCDTCDHACKAWLAMSLSLRTLNSHSSGGRGFLPDATVALYQRSRDADPLCACFAHMLRPQGAPPAFSGTPPHPRATVAASATGAPAPQLLGRPPCARPAVPTRSPPLTRRGPLASAVREARVGMQGLYAGQLC